MYNRSCVLSYIGDIPVGFRLMCFIKKKSCKGLASKHKGEMKLPRTKYVAELTKEIQKTS